MKLISHNPTPQLIVELQATHQKSFYNKAHIVIDINNVKYLKSYDTFVCCIDTEGIFHRLWSGYSATTAKHIHDFRLLYALPPLPKKQWDALPIE